MNKRKYYFATVINLVFCGLVIYLNSLNKFYIDPRLSFLTLIMLSILCLGHFREINKAMKEMSKQMNADNVNNILNSLNLIIFYCSCIMYYLPRANMFGYVVFSKRNFILNVVCILIVLITVLLKRNSNAFNYLSVVICAIFIWDFKYFEYLILGVIFFIYLIMKYIKFNYCYSYALAMVIFCFCLILLVYSRNVTNIDGIINFVIYIFLLCCVISEMRGRKRNE